MTSHRPQVDMDHHHTGLEALDEATCLALLADRAVGRLGISERAMPVILPVNYALDGMSLVFCTETGAKLTAARAGDVACLEVDDWEAVSHDGWSVLATGRLELITDPDELESVWRLPLNPWRHMASPPHYVRLPIEVLSGRRLRPLEHG